MMSRKYPTLALLLCSILIFIQFFSPSFVDVHQTLIEVAYSFTGIMKTNPGDDLNLGFSRFAFEEAKINEKELENEYTLTAILLHWQRLSGVQKAVAHFLDTKLFKEIIIWNNNPQMNLTIDQILTSNHSSKLVRIINAKENLKDEAKYRACIEARTRACFYADDDWDTSRYTRSLVAAFRSDPNLLHSVTDSYTYYTNLVWSYMDSKIDLHTGFAWIGCGSVFLRKHAERHVQLLATYLQMIKVGSRIVTLLQISFYFAALITLADVFFSIWLNDIPSQINTDIRSLPRSLTDLSTSFSSTARFPELQHKSSVLAISLLENALRSNEPNGNLTFSRRQIRRFPYYVKSSSLNDDFLFYSNVLPLDIEPIPFNISKDFERGTRRNLPQGPNVDHFMLYSTTKAVDNKLNSCWQTNRAVRKGDFFAIDFLRIQTNITFTLFVSHSRKMQDTLDMGISFDGLQWLFYRSLKGISTRNISTSDKNQLYMITFDSAGFSLGFEFFRYVAFHATNTFDVPFRVCEITIGKNFTTDSFFEQKK